MCSKRLSLSCLLLALSALSFSEAQAQITEIIDTTGEPGGGTLFNPTFVTVDSRYSC